MQSSWSELVDLCDRLVDSLNSLDSPESVGAGESGFDSGMDSAFGLPASLAAV